MTAASLKVLQHRTTPLAGQGLLSNPWVALAGVEAELVVGVWLLSGLHPRTSRLITIVLFSVFAVVSLRQALAQKVSCGCFGNLPVRPWSIFLFDVLAVVCLSLTSPPPAPTVRSAPRRFRAAIGAVLVLGTAAGVVMLSQPRCPIAASPDPSISAKPRPAALPLPPSSWRTASAYRSAWPRSGRRASV